MSKRVTKAAAKSLLKRHCADLDVKSEITSDEIEFRCEGDYDLCDRLERAIDAMIAETGRGHYAVLGNARVIYYYKSDSAPDMGDYCDTSSRIHY